MPNCTTIVTVMPLKPLHDAGRLRRVVATSSVGFGRRRQRPRRSPPADPGLGARRSDRPRHFAHQLAFVLIPHIDRPGADGYSGEELKLIHETRKILEAPDLPISPTTVRVPVFTCHSVSVNAETEEKISAERARELFARFPGLKVWDEPAEQRYPMPILVEGQDVTAGWVGFARTSPTPAA